MINFTKTANAFIVLILTLLTISSALATNSIALTSVWTANNTQSLSVDQGARPEMLVFVTSNADFRLWIEVLQGSSVVRSVINGLNVPADLDTPYIQRFAIDTTSLSGDYRVHVQTLNAGGSADQFLNLHVNPVNSVPQFSSITDKSVNEGVLLTFTTTATDADGNVLTYSAGTLPLGARFDPLTHEFMWTPDFTQAGTYSVQFFVNDGRSTVSQAVTITVNNVNRAPVFTPVADETISERSWLTFPVTAVDPDGDALTYSVTNLPTGATFDPATRTFQWRPDFGQAGEYPVTFHATDGTLERTITVTITVTPVDRPAVECADGVDNDGDGLIDLADAGCADAADDDESNIIPPENQVPTLTITGTTTINEGETLRLTATAADADSDPLTIAFDETLPGRNPSMRLVAENTAEFMWVSGFADAGVYTVTFEVFDGFATTTQTVPITVNNINRVPTVVIIPDTEKVSVREGEMVQFTVVMRDHDGEIPKLEYRINGLLPAQADAAVQVILGTEKPFGRLFDFFRFQNQLPPGTALVIISPNYDFVRHPAVFKRFSIDLIAHGAESESEPVRVPVLVRDVNRQPVLAPIGNKAVGVGQLLEFGIIASDADRDRLTYAAAGLPEGASFDTTTGQFSWIPNASQVGNHSMTFTVSDQFSGVDGETITVLVSVAPVAQCADGIDNDGDGLTDLADAGCADAADDDESNVVPPTQCADGADNDGDGLTDSDDPGCSNADDNDESNGVVPPGSTQCSDTVDNDGDGFIDLADTGCINETDNDESNIILPINRAPMVTITGTTTINEGETLRLTATAADVDNDFLIMSFTETLPGAAPALQVTGVNTRVLTWTSGFADAGIYTVTFTVNDGVNQPVSQTVTVTVGNVNGAPVITSIPVDLIREGQEYRYQVVAVDPDNDPLTYRLIEAPPGMTMNAAGVITWTPARTQRASVKIVVSDGQFNAYQYYTLGVREMKEDLKISRAGVTPEVAQVNGYIVVSAALLNDGPMDLEDLRVEVSFPEWGIGRISASFDLDQGDQWSREMGFQVPEYVEPGQYLVQIAVDNDAFREVTYRIVYVE